MKRGIIVVKIGTSTVVKKSRFGSERLNKSAFKRIGKQIVNLKKQGYGVIIVSSAAITAGMMITKTPLRPSRSTDMPELQRLASIGWRDIINAWDNATGKYTIGELLLTRHSLNLTSERKEALNVIHCLLSHGDIPIINENDAVTHDEIAFGDNDTLAATVAAKIAQSELFRTPVSFIILSDIEGVYRDKDDPSTLIPLIKNIDSLSHVISGAGSTNGTGGMITKFEAARIATASGVPTYITHGRHDKSLTNALSGRRGTKFEPTTH